jgi:hypothetical protein
MDALIVVSLLKEEPRGHWFENNVQLPHTLTTPFWVFWWYMFIQVVGYEAQTVHWVSCGVPITCWWHDNVFDVVCKRHWLLVSLVPFPAANSYFLTRPAIFPNEHRRTESVCYYAIISEFDVLLYLDMWRNHYTRDVTT